ncbi:MAG TPA: hypothetical protein VMR97_00200 [Acidimicrobiales bacterium]|nr:hypothetical protein [Acidimicrobiales bacterium]
MGYVDAGYAAALGTLAAYAALLWFRRRRLEQLAASLEDQPDAHERPSGVRA